MATPLLLPPASSSTDGDLVVWKSSSPARTRRKRRRNAAGVLVETGEIVTLEPAKEREVHASPKGLLYLAGAVAAGAVAAVAGLVAWNGVKVRNPVPIGDRVLTVLPGVRDSPGAQKWLDDPLRAHRERVIRRRLARKSAAADAYWHSNEGQEKIGCVQRHLNAGMSIDRAIEACGGNP